MQNKIKFLRKQRGITQEDLALQVGMARSTLSSIENNKRNFKVNDLIVFAKTFQTSLEEVIGQSNIEVISNRKDGGSIQPSYRISVPQRKIEKMKEVILYLVRKIGAQPNMGQTVLYKLLYFSDFDYYEKFEKQLTGATYVKNKFGPIPVEFMSVINEMAQNSEIKIVQTEYFGYVQTRYLANRDPKLEMFSADEIKVIDNVISKLGDMSASQVSEYSHGDVPWIYTQMGDPIKYDSVFYRTKQYSVRRYEYDDEDQ